MINGLSKYTKNAGSAVAYFLDDKYFELADGEEVDLDNYDPSERRGEWLDREPKPVVLEGDPAQMIALCNSLTFKNRYTSGVLSFSPEETAHIAANPGMKEQLIEELRGFAYAGVKRDDCKPLFVAEHTHTGRLELHYLIPRVGLESGKYFNPFPPNYNGQRGKGANKDFIRQNDSFVDYVCNKYGLRNPRDPEVARSIKYDKFDPEKATKKFINDRVSKMVKSGSIQSREDIVSYLKESGGVITRKGEDYLSVKFGDNKAIRLKGDYYSDRTFDESRQKLQDQTERVSRATSDIDADYGKVLSERAGHVEKRHSLKGLAAERADEFDRKSGAELESYADELSAIKNSLPDSSDFSRRVSDHIAADSTLVNSTESGQGIESGIADGTSDADPILTGNPGSDQLIRAFHQMQKKMASEEIQRAKARHQIDPNHEKMVREFTDSMTKLFGGLAMGKNLISGRPGAMSPGDIAMARQMLKEQHAELQRELRAVAAVQKVRERTEPLREILKPSEPEAKAVVEAKAKAVEAKPQPALSQHFADFIDKTVVLNKAQDIKKIGSKPVLRAGWMAEKVQAVRQEAQFWNKNLDAAVVEQAIVAKMQQEKIPAMQTFEAVLKDSAVKPGDAAYAAQVVALKYTKEELKAEGKAEVDPDVEARTRYAELYKRAESGTDAMLKAQNEKSQAEGLADSERLAKDAELAAEAFRLELEERRLLEGEDGTTGTTLG